MELKSFREILLKKADGDPRLELLAEYITEERLAIEVIESLRKMAKLTHHVSRNPNPALLHYAKEMTPEDTSQVRDALGHHISHYRGALKAIKAAPDAAQKETLRGEADKHLNKIVPLAHMAAKAGHHSGGTIDADLPPIRPWEANYTGTHRFPTDQPTNAKGLVEHVDPLTNKEREGRPGVELEGTQGWKRRAANLSDEKKKTHDQNKSRGVYDYRYLEMPPHGDHEGLKETTHRGGFPFEDIRVGSGPEVASGGGHLPIEEVNDFKKFVEHPYDKHPIHDMFNRPSHQVGEQAINNLSDSMKGWEDSPQFKEWLAGHEKMHEKDPEAYAARGSKKPSHVYEGLDLQPQTSHAAKPAPFVPREVKESPAKSAQAPASDTSSSAGSRKTILKKQPKASPEQQLEEQRNVWKKLDPETRKFMKQRGMFTEDEFKA